MTRSAKARKRSRRLGQKFVTRLIFALMGLLVVSGSTSEAAENLKKTGTLTIEQVQIAFIGSGNLGGGTLRFGGRNYPFSIGGLGIGGIGVSKIKAKGDVYNLTNLAHFPGAYAQGRYGYAAGNSSMGELWLQNSNGVVLKLKAEREGLALSLGGDAVYIKLD